MPLQSYDTQERDTFNFSSYDTPATARCLMCSTSLWDNNSHSVLNSLPQASHFFLMVLVKNTTAASSSVVPEDMVKHYYCFVIINIDGRDYPSKIFLFLMWQPKAIIDLVLLVFVDEFLPAAFRLYKGSVKRILR